MQLIFSKKTQKHAFVEKLQQLVVFFIYTTKKPT